MRQRTRYTFEACSLAVLALAIGGSRAFSAPPVASAKGAPSWTLVNHLPDPGEVGASIVASETTLIYSISLGPTYLSFDGGATWSKDPLSGASASSILIAPSDGSRLYGNFAFETGEEGVQRSLPMASHDGGKTWTPTPDLPALLAISPTDANLLYGFAPSRGFVRSADGGATWETLLAETDSPDTTNVALGRDGAIYAITADDQRVTFRASTGPKGTLVRTGTLVAGNAGGEKVLVDAKDSRTLYTTRQDGRALARSSDRGATWKNVYVGEDDSDTIADIAIDPRRGHTLYVAGAHVLTSSNGGKTWQRIDPTDGNLGGYRIALAGDVLYAFCLTGQGPSLYRLALPTP